MKLIILAAFVGVCTAAALQPQYRYQYPRYQYPNYQFPNNQYSNYQYANNQYPNNQYPNYQYQYQDQRARTAIDKNAQILRSDSEVTPQGYRYAYETYNGIQAEESGVENNGNNAAGSYSYTGDDGQVYAVRYTADANGFQPQGAHIPTPPPIPEAIARSLEANARDEAAGIYDDGSYRGEGNTPAVVLGRQYYNQNKYYPYARFPNRYY